MTKRQDDYETTKEFALYMIEHGSTIRQVATKFHVSKSTIHIRLTKKLPQLNNELYTQVRDILDKNKAARATRGGEATRQKYLKTK